VVSLSSLHEPLHDDRCQSRPTHGIRPLPSTPSGRALQSALAMMVRVDEPAVDSTSPYWYPRFAEILNAVAGANPEEHVTCPLVLSGGG
jgi:hypothetical protein